MGVARQVPLEAFRRFDNDVRIRHGQGADQRSRNLARHAQRQQMMHEWIAAHGSHDQRERLSAGVLPFEEFVDALTDVTFRPLSHLAAVPDGRRRQNAGAASAASRSRRRRRRRRVTCRSSRVCSRRPRRSSGRWCNEIRSIIPGAQVQLRERSLAWTRDAHAPRLRLVSALVTTKVGPAAAPTRIPRSRQCSGCSGANAGGRIDEGVATKRHV